MLANARFLYQSQTQTPMFYTFTIFCLTNFFAPYILQPKKLVKNSKTLIDIFSNSIEYLFWQFNFENIGPSYKIVFNSERFLS